MGTFTGDYSQNPLSGALFDEEKRYQVALFQINKNLIDADLNTAFSGLYRLLRRVVQNSIGDGALTDAFKIAEHRTTGNILVENSFKLLGGKNASSGPWFHFLGGHPAFLSAEVVWGESPEVSPYSTAITGNILSDTAAFYEANELVGRNLVPDIAQPSKKWPIIANTQTSITISSSIDLVAEGIAPGAQYKVLLTTPSVARQDVVYLDVYLDEFGKVEDSDLGHAIASGQEAARRKKLIQTVHVREGFLSLPTSYQQIDGRWLDADGNEHFLIIIGQLNRTVGNAEIPVTEIEDKRRIIFKLDEVDDKFVNVLGDTMTGNLLFTGSGKIQGTDVVGESEITDESLRQFHFARDDHLLGDGGTVPLASNLPLVHDNRYFTKSLMLTSFGENLFVNGSLQNGFVGWENLSPAPLFGAPGAEAQEKAKVLWNACGVNCCRSILLNLDSSFGGCDIIMVAQDVDICGGGFFAYQISVKIQSGNDDLRLKPFLKVVEYASGQKLGSQRIGFKAFVEDGPSILLQDHLISKADNFQRLTSFFGISPQADSLKVFVGVEVIFPCCNIIDEANITFCDLVLKKFAAQGQIVDGVFETPPFLGLPQNEGQYTAGLVNSPIAARSDIATGHADSTPKIISVDDNGVVEYEAGYFENALQVYRRDPDPNNFAPGALFLWTHASPGTAYNPQLLETIVKTFGTWFMSAVGVAVDDFQITSLSLNEFEVDNGTVTVTFRGRFIPQEIDLQITANPFTDVTINNIDVDESGLFGTFDLTLGVTAPVGPVTFRFTRISDSVYDDIVALFKAKASPAPVIYSVSSAVLAGATPLNITLRGDNFIVGNTSVSSLNSNVSVILGTVTASEVQLTLTKQAGLNPPPSVPVTIRLSTPFGTDDFTVWVVPTKIEKTIGNITYEGEPLPSVATGFGGTLQKLKLVFDAGKTYLDVQGGNLNNVTQIQLFQARVDGRERGSQGGLRVVIVNAFESILPPYYIQHATGIRVDLSQILTGGGNLTTVPFAVRFLDSGGQSVTYVLEQDEQLQASSAFFHNSNYGPQLNGGVIEVDGANIHGGVLVSFNRTIENLGSFIHQFRPSSVLNAQELMAPTEQPVDISQPMYIQLLAAPFGLSNPNDLASFGVIQVGTSPTSFGVSSVIAATLNNAVVVVDNVVPNELEQGGQRAISILGVGFRHGATVEIAPTNKFTVENVVVNPTGTLITCNVTVASDAVLGNHTLTVINTDNTQDSLTTAITVTIPETAIVVALESGDGNPNSPSMQIVLDPSVDTFSVIEGRPSVMVGGKDLNPHLVNDGYFRFQLKPENALDATMTFLIVDTNGVKLSKNLGLLSALSTATWNQIDVLFADLQGPGVFDWLHVEKVQFTFAPQGTSGTTEVLIDQIEVKSTSPTYEFLVEDFAYANTAQLNQKWIDAGANHVVGIGYPISREIVPLVNVPSETVQDFGFYGDTGWDERDIVLLPYTDTNVANMEYDWADAGTGRKVFLNNANFRNAPALCCRNIMVEVMYIEESGCRAVEAEQRTYQLPNTACDCAPPSTLTQVVGEPVEDPLLYRFLPDDGHDGTPEVYGESFWLRYCQNQNLPYVTECSWVSLGSKSTPLQVYYAGGGRNDPNIATATPVNPATNEKIYVTVYLGPGSPQGGREALLAQDLLPAAGVTVIEIVYASIGNDGFAVGQKVWLMNYKDPVTNGMLRLSPFDIMDKSDDPKYYGVYGTIRTIDSDDYRITIDLDEPMPANAQFRTAWGARLLVSPKNRMGYYWEASKGLAQLVSGQSGVVIQWGFKFWNAPWRGLFSGVQGGTDAPAGILIADGDGEQTEYLFTNPTNKILIEREWLSLFAAPTRAQYLTNDAPVGATYINVCAAFRFNEGDTIEILDSSFSPGFRTSIIGIDNVLNRLYLKDPIPTLLPGVPTIDGFLTSRQAQVYRLVTRVNNMACITEDANEDGTPTAGVGSVVIDYEAGNFTFDENQEGYSRIFYLAKQSNYQLPDDPGTYGFRSVSKYNHVGDWSTPIYVGVSP